MPPAYTEDQLVERPAIGLFAELGWTTVLAAAETFGATGTLQRETKGEVVWFPGCARCWSSGIPRCHPRPLPPPLMN
jgi:hypothetical protein